jgi:hypothetical protein
MIMKSFVAQAAYNDIFPTEQKLLRHDAESIMEAAFAVKDGRDMYRVIPDILRQFNINEQVQSPSGMVSNRQYVAYKFFLYAAYKAREEYERNNEHGVKEAENAETSLP